uniref:ATP-dependent helicase HrpB n=1 Tax=Tetradesmus obliquus TaxID=3088 RepID=A0A383V6U4_TETOB|eukprot:jgi/Sobl393_1/278/SZX60066.1
MVLEPRRVAAKAAARRMASLLGEPVGRTVGYKVKLESRVSSATRIEVVTEGILLRRLQQDPSLEGVGALLLDEFHERSLDADTSLALALDCQAWARPDLRLVVMSATLGGGLAEDLQDLMAAAAGGSSSSSSSGSSSSEAAVPVVISEGRSYPVTTHFLGKPLLQKPGELERAAADAVLKALASQAAAGGDVLCFMPGVAEIRRLQQLLQQDSVIRKAGIAVQQLHGGLSPQQQDEVIRPNRSLQQRRVVIATPIAESSITIDGVTAVVDSGLARAPCYSPATGISRLLTQRISQDSAEQRRGRAGRTQPGVCYRLWGQDDHQQLLRCTLPEICSADLAQLALQLASWGSPDGQGLAWLDPPEPQALADARQLLLELAAVDEKGSLTATGRRMAALPAHPRFAHMVLRAQQLGVAELGCLLAALLSERDLFRGSSSSSSGSRAGGDGTDPGADLTTRLKVLAGEEAAPAGFDHAGASRVLLGAQQILRQLQASTAAAAGSTASIDDPSSTAASTVDELDEAESSMAEDDDDELQAESNDSPAAAAVGGQPSGSSSSSGGLRASSHADPKFNGSWQQQLRKPGLLGALVAAAYPDRIAQLKPGSGGKPSYTLSTGRVVTLPSAGDPLAGQQYIAAAELQAGRDGRNDRVVLGAALTQAAIQAYLKDEIQDRLLVFWASASKQVIAKQQRVLGSLVLSEQAAKADDDRALPVLLKALASGGYSSLPVPAAAEAWRSRAAWLHAAEVAATGSSSVPDLSAAALMGRLEHWLLPHLAGVRSRGQLQQLRWMDIFKGQMDWAAQQHVDEAAPTHLQLPTGSTAAIDYSGAQPSAAVKMQEVFGLADTPLLGGRARVPLVLQLLSPAGRPLQVTANLASFWAESYQAVKKEMKGRYPKHIWPDDPANTAATKLTKKQMAAAAGADSGSSSSSSSSSGGKPNNLSVVNKKSRR